MATRRERQRRRKQGGEGAAPASGTVSAGVTGVLDRHYKKLLIIPFVILALALLQIGVQYANTGSFLLKSVSLQGGLTITVNTDALTPAEAEALLLEEFPQRDIIARAVSDFGQQQALVIEVGAEEDAAGMVALEEELLAVLQQRLPGMEYSTEVIGPSLGNAFFVQTLKAVAIAFLFMGAVVFFYFGHNKTAKYTSAGLTLLASIFVFQFSGILLLLPALLGLILIGIYVKYSPPSAAVILAAASDIIVTLAIVNLLGIKISGAGIAAFLMLVGYSVDTDILLSTRVLKRLEGTIHDRIVGAFKTGMTMMVTSIVAALIGLLVSQSDTIRQIMLIILIGLLVDIVNTWLQNAGIIRIYAERAQ